MFIIYFSADPKPSAYPYLKIYYVINGLVWNYTITEIHVCKKNNLGISLQLE